MKSSGWCAARFGRPICRRESGRQVTNSSRASNCTRRRQKLIENLTPCRNAESHMPGTMSADRWDSWRSANPLPRLPTAYFINFPMSFGGLQRPTCNKNWCFLVTRARAKSSGRASWPGMDRREALSRCRGNTPPLLWPLRSRRASADGTLAH